MKDILATFGFDSRKTNMATMTMLGIIYLASAGTALPIIGLVAGVGAVAVVAQGIVDYKHGPRKPQDTGTEPQPQPGN